MLWDCIKCLSTDTAKRIRSIGGIQAIAISHPHFYTGMADWAGEFDCPVYVHEKDRQWVTQPSDRIRFWTGKSANFCACIPSNCKLQIHDACSKRCMRHVCR